MKIQARTILNHSPLGSGGVSQFTLPEDRKVTRITTFIPEEDGPGPMHAYLIEDTKLILVDTGIPTGFLKELSRFWQRGSTPSHIKDLPDDYSEQELIRGINAAGHSVKDIDILFITHGHPDHYLIGNSIVEKSGARVLAHLLDTGSIHNPWRFILEGVELWTSILLTGMPVPRGRIKKLREAMKRIIMDQQDSVSLNVDEAILSDGPLTARGYKSEWIEVRHFPGHSPGGLCLILGTDMEENRVMISGDTLLYPISPHPDNLVDYLATLRDFMMLEGISLVLPAHGETIEDFHGRVSFLKEHHKKRLRLTYDFCNSPGTIWEIANIPGYFDIPLNPKVFNPMAGREALIHVELLEKAGGLTRSHYEGPVCYFRNKGRPFEEVYEQAMEIVEKGRANRLS